MNDLYRGLVKYTTGATMLPGEYHIPTLNEHFSLSNPVPFDTSSVNYAGPGTKIVSRVRNARPDENKNLSFL
jgi:hypothetical protein